MRSKLSAAILLLSSVAAAQPPEPKPEPSDADAFIQAVDAKFKARKARLALLERGLRDPAIRRNSKLGGTSRMRREIKHITALLEVAAIPNFILKRFKVGEVGHLTYSTWSEGRTVGAATVVQVFPPDAILLKATLPGRTGGRESFKLLWIDGIDTKDQITNKTYRTQSFPGMFRVVTPKTYRTVRGGTNTVTQLRSLDMKAIQPDVEQWIADWRKKAGTAKKTEPTAKPAAPNDKRSAEEQAAAKLLLAKRLLKTNKRAAKKRLAAIVKDFPKTDAAKTARALLKKR